MFLTQVKEENREVFFIVKRRFVVNKFSFMH